MHGFYKSAVSTLCFILSTNGGKIKQHVYIKFCVKLSKSATKTLEMLHSAFREYSLSWTAVFESHSHFMAS
jgi:hypothetical protein